MQEMDEPGSGKLAVITVLENGKGQLDPVVTSDQCVS